MASAGKSDQIINDFLQNVKTRDPAKTGTGKISKTSQSIQSTNRHGNTLTNSLAYSPSHASPLKSKNIQAIIE